MLITRNPKDCWQDKAQYCQDNNIQYKCIEYKRFGDEDFIDGTDTGHYKSRFNTFFTHWTIIGSSGVQGYFYACLEEGKDNICNMSPPLMKEMTQSCPTCVGTLGLLDFMDDSLRQKLAVRRDRYVYHNSVSEK